jgi:hypothetical protein
MILEGQLSLSLKGGVFEKKLWKLKSRQVTPTILEGQLSLSLKGGVFEKKNLGVSILTPPPL